MKGFDKRVVACLALLVWVAYGSTANLGFISDDYVYIAKARAYAAPAQWPALFGDVLYRTRATTIWTTGLLDHAFGLLPVAFNLASILVHAANVMLLYGLGRWRPIGWPVAIVAAGYFAVAERPHEAIMWYSALPDLLALTFSLAALHGLLSWLRGQAAGAWLFSFSFLLGLLSKESATAMVAFAALILWFDPRAQRRHWAALAAMAAGVGLYAALIFARSASHYHLNDGTFVFGGHAVLVLFNSLTRLLWVWGVAALALLLLWRPLSHKSLRAIGFALLWMVPALAPYSFLSYMNTVPSRHTYLANVGVALLAGVAGCAAWRRWRKQHRWALATLAAALVLHNTGYIWLVKKPAFAARAEYTERLIDRAARNAASPLPVSNRDFPFTPELARDAILVRTGQDRPVVFVD